MTRASLVLAAVIAACAGCGQPPQPPAVAAKPTTNPAPDTTVFGVVHMGLPLALPKCSGYDDERPCVGGPAPGGMEWEVRIPALRESYRYASVGVREMDGAVHSATVRSLEHYSAPEEVLAELVEKYGRPTTVVERSKYARWDFDDLHVTWSGRTPDSRHATVFFRTPEGERAFRADSELGNAQIPKL